MENMREIELTLNMTAIVDDGDFDRLSKFTWYAKPGRQTSYAITNINKNGSHKHIRMHRMIMGLEDSPYPLIDHKNRNGLDNRRDNLRIATVNQNRWNAGVGRMHTSKYKGVSWDKNRGKWTSHICKNGKQNNIGRFDNEIDAALAYDERARKIYGEFAFVNFPDITKKHHDTPNR